MAAQDGIKAGRVAKPYGLRGELQLILLPSSTEYLKEGTFLFIDLDGQRVPFFLEDVEVLNPEQAIVKFEFVDDKEEARKFTGSTVYFDPALKLKTKDEDPGPLALEGYTVVDEKQGELGTIREVLSNKANPLWVIEGNQGEILVPATADFIRKVESRRQILRVDLPEGLTGV